MAPLTIQTADGLQLSFIRPGNAITGSPFSVTNSPAVTTAAGALDDMKGILVHIVTGSIHVVFSQAGTLATTSDFRLEALSQGNQPYVFPVRQGDRLSMIKTTAGTSTVFIHPIDE